MVIAHCLLCRSTRTKHFCHSEDRDYYRCEACDLVFVPKAFWLSNEDEKKRYDAHRYLLDEGYRSFLDRLLLPMEAYLKSGAVGLDFGSGPTDALGSMMRERGYEMDRYDLFYHDDRSVFDKRYDFITMSEVLEHLHDPMKELIRLWKLLKSGGVMGIMTAFRVDDFEHWYYKRDLTHIAFYTPQSFESIAKRIAAKIVYMGKDVVILQKGGDEQ